MGGDLDLSNAPALERAIHRAEVARPPVLVLDLRSATFIDSTILRSVVAAHIRARREGRRFAVAATSEMVRRLFRITLLEWRLEVVDEPADVRVDPAGSDDAGDRR